MNWQLNRPEDKDLGSRIYCSCYKALPTICVESFTWLAHVAPVYILMLQSCEIKLVKVMDMNCYEYNNYEWCKTKRKQNKLCPTQSYSRNWLRHFWDSILRNMIHTALHSNRGVWQNTLTHSCADTGFFWGWSEPPLRLSAIFFACWFAQDPATIWIRSWNSCTKPPLLNVRNPPFWILDPPLTLGALPKIDVTNGVY